MATAADPTALDPIEADLAEHSLYARVFEASALVESVVRPGRRTEARAARRRIAAGAVDELRRLLSQAGRG